MCLSVHQTKRIKNHLPLALLLFSYLTIQYITNEILVEKFLIEKFGSLTSQNEMLEMLKSFRAKSLILYTISIPVLLFKLLFISLIISTSFYLSEYRVSLNTSFKASVWSEFLHLVPDLGTICMSLYFSQENESFGLGSFKNPSLFDLAHLFINENTKYLTMTLQPLKLFNLIELAFVVVASKILANSLTLDFCKTFKIVFLGYLLSLIIISVLLVSILFLFIKN